jgi:hypothetical protein
MAVICLILAALGLAFSGYVAYISIQSLRQGKLLLHPLPLARLKEHLNEPVAVHGRPELLGGQTGPFGSPVLWYRQVNQEYRRMGKNSSWRTVSKNERCYDFFLHFTDGGRVFVTGEPSEVHGGEKRTDGESTFFNYHGQRRTIYTWLSVVPVLTVLGELGLSKHGATLLPSKSHGLLFSTSLPESAARIEYLKGLTGLCLAVGVIVGMGILFVCI